MTSIKKLDQIAEKYKIGKIDLDTAIHQSYSVGVKDIASNSSNVIHDVSESDLNDFELQRLFDWLQDDNREPAKTKFTTGMTRNVAREFEYLLKH